VEDLLKLFETFNVITLMRAGVLLALGLIAAALTRSLVGRWVRKHASLHQTILLQRMIYYSVLLIFIISAFDQLGFEMKTLLGVAGIFTVAIGFASQTAASNVISGLFMIGEKHFEIGDRIQVDDTVGDVLSLDFLSVKLRKLDNSMVRIPNESLLKSIVVNHSRFSIRRFDLILRLSFQEDLEILTKLLVETAKKHPDCLEKPEPELIFKEYSESAIKIQFSSWCTQEKYPQFKTTMSILISKILQERNITIPSPLFDHSKIL
jgi:small conductance mechanosensitive channel